MLLLLVRVLSCDLVCFGFVVLVLLGCRAQAAGCSGCPHGTFTVGSVHNPVFGDPNTLTTKLLTVVSWSSSNPNGIACSNMCCKGRDGAGACCVCTCFMPHVSLTGPHTISMLVCPPAYSSVSDGVAVTSVYCNEGGRFDCQISG